jgi:hypothetical protein
MTTVLSEGRQRGLAIGTRRLEPPLPVRQQRAIDQAADVRQWEVRTVYGIDPADQWVYFSAIKDSPIAENVYRVKIADGTIERLSQGTGNHSPAFNANFTLLSIRGATSTRRCKHGCTIRQGNSSRY